jgi:hypothetical protein
MTHAYNPKPWEAEVGGSGVWDQPGPQSEFMVNLTWIASPCLKKTNKIRILYSLCNDELKHFNSYQN